MNLYPVSARSPLFTAFLVTTTLLLTANLRPAHSQPPAAPADPAADAEALAVIQKAEDAAPAIRVEAEEGGAVLLDAAPDPATRPPKVPAAPGQAFTVTLRYPAARIGQEIVADALDGGRINGKSAGKFMVPPDGRLRFTFTAGTNPGLYTVELRPDDGTNATLEFQVKVAPAN